MEHVTGKINLAKATITSAISALLCLMILHFVSTEFEPGWRMVSEYALGSHKWLITLFFLLWAIASWCLSFVLWEEVTTKAGKAGVILLFITGIGQSLAALYDVSQPEGHGVAALFGIPTLPIAVLLISYHITKKEEWKNYRGSFLLSAHATWVSLVLVVVTMMIMMAGFKEAGIEFGPDSQPPKSVPDGVIAVVGYANRLLIIAYIYWLILAATTYLKVRK